MRSALGYARPYSKREPSGIEASAASADTRPVAIVDIGSNSVRLVIYDGPWRRASILHNRKTICALGRNMVRTGRLYPPGVELALDALAQFRLIAAGYGVGTIQAVATAAARDAQDGTKFVGEAEKILGAPIGVLPG
ncbi:MAG: hypothetical protein IID54_05815, partial [Proteobacteria bacterium]|nr:hypothetical protein [Pseudomonadota bacterium]